MMLDIRSLQFAYKKHTVLKGVDFSADAGECICVLGENGAGKTTLFRCLLGFLSSYDGEILIDGVDVRQMSVRELAKRIAYIPQAHAPAFNFSVFEIVLMGTNVLTERFCAPGKDESCTAEQMLELLNIVHLRNRGYAELSGGERQLVLIARALAQKSRILVMDEPTANLDYGNQLRVMSQVRQLAEQGYLVVLSTHNPEHALLFANRALVIKEGVSAIYGKPEAVLTPDVIESVYGVSVELQRLTTRHGDVPVFVPCLE